MKKFYLLIYIIVLFSNISIASDSSFEIKQVRFQNNRLETFLELDLKKDWKIYWKNPGTFGLGTNIELKKSDADDISVIWLIPEIEYNKSEKTVTYYYKDKVIIPVDFIFNKTKEKQIVRLNINYAMCNQICIPKSQEIKFEVNQKVNNEKFLNDLSLKKIAATIIEERPHENFFHDLDLKLKDGRRFITVNVKGNITKPNIIIDGFNNIQLENFSSNKNSASLTFSVPDKDNYLTDDIFTAIMVSEERNANKQFSVNKFDVQEVDDTIYKMILIAIIGGFILNFMPCVLPVLSIKLMSIIKANNHNKIEIIKNSFATILGIISCFLILASFAISIQKGGEIAGLGMNFENTNFVIFMIIVLTSVAANILGFYEVHVPSSILNIAGKEMPKLLSNYLSGFLATILATPCSAPFVGVALAFALSKGSNEIIVIFLSMGLGLALPYFLICLWPDVIFKIPKSGPWMEKFKKILGYSVIATMIWLLYVLSMQLSYYSAFILFVMMLLMKFVLERNDKFLKNNILKILTLTLIIAFSFKLPYLAKVMAQEEEAKYESIWHKFDSKIIEKKIKEGKIVVIDITADWCVTCKVNKFFVLESREVMKVLKSKEIYAMRGELNSSNQDIRKFMKNHNRYAIPFNVIYGPKAKNGIVVSEVLSKEEFIKAIKEAK